MGVPLPSPSKLNRAFLYANIGPQVCKLLADDETYARVFSADLPDIKNHEKFTAQDRTKILDAFVAASCPQGTQTSPQILRWVFDQYLTHLHNGKPIQAEDLYKVKDNLTYFDSLKQSQPFKDSGQRADLLQYKTYAAFEEMLAPFIKQKQLKEEAARQFNMPPEKRAKIMSETTVLYQGPEGMVVIPHTPESSQHWGSNTKWCIAGKESAATHFPSYNTTSPVIMIIPTGMQDQKVALVDDTLYDSADKTIDALPPQHFALLQSGLNRLSPSARQGIDPWVAKKLAGAVKKEKTHQEIKKDKLLQQVEREINLFSTVQGPNPKLWSDRKFVLAAVQQCGWTLRYAHEDLRKDWGIVLAAVQQYGLALQYAHEDLKNDKKFINQALRQASVDFIFLAKKEIKKTGIKLSNAELLGYQINALERLAEQGDQEKFVKYARLFKETWGDPESLFAPDMLRTVEKIKSAHQPAAKPQARKATAAMV